MDKTQARREISVALNDIARKLVADYPDSDPWEPLAHALNNKAHQDRIYYDALAHHPQFTKNTATHPSCPPTT